MKHLKIGGVAVVAGFQGINIENRVTTLGRGASDYSAILLSKYFKAKKYSSIFILRRGKTTLNKN